MIGENSTVNYSDIIQKAIKSLKCPKNIYTYEQVCKSDNIPESGVYAWYFTNFMELISANNCYKLGNSLLVYIGICPKSDRQLTSRKLKTRVVDDHYMGNARRSTLRCTVGNILNAKTNLPAKRRCKFKPFDHVYEEHLSQWMKTNASVTFYKFDMPWCIEKDIIKMIDPPLNLTFHSWKDLCASYLAI